MRIRVVTLFVSLVIGVCAVAQTPAPKKATGAAPAAAATPAAAPSVAAKPATPGAAAAATPAPAPLPDTAVVMSVGDQKITRAEFEKILAAMPEQVRASATGPNKRKFAEQLGDLMALATEARRQHLDEKPEVKQRIAIQVDQLLAGEIYQGFKPDEAALRSYFDQHKSEFDEITARHILVRFKGSPVPARSGQPDLTEEEALAKAKALREKLATGGDFAAIAKAESDDTGSGANGGDLGTFGHGRMVPGFEQAAFALPAGQISEPVKTQFGYHLIKVEGHKTKSFEDNKPAIEARVRPELANKGIQDVKKTIPVTLNDQYFAQ